MICGAAVFALGLAACGGGSDGVPQATHDEVTSEVETLRAQIAALEERLGIEDGADPGHDVADLQEQIDRLQGMVDAADAAAKKAADDAAAEKAKMEAAAMAATAAKLYAGISDRVTATGATTRNAAYSGTNDSGITVSIGGLDADGNALSPVPTYTLSEDKDTTVTANHGWAGKRYADPAGGDMVEAMVYSNVGEPTQGDKFGQIGITTAVSGYVYGLSAAGMVAVDTSATAAHVNRVGGSSFDQSAGVKRFSLPSPNPNSQTVVTVPGSFHGVSGTYTCTPATAVCAANVSGRGFQLGTVPSATDATFTDGGGTWMFKPANPESRVTESADTHYASYGWWIRKSADGKTFTASAFVDNKDDGTTANVPAATGLNALNGTATYQGGAAGKYALSSSTGGTNDAGHFTARATLEADFTVNTADDTTTNGITGMIDMFIGADGESRDWEVKLNGSPIADTGGIGDTTDGTEWSIDGTAAADDGNWTGTLQNNGSDGVPQVATGTFYSTYGTAGKMVGAFGANKE